MGSKLPQKAVELIMQHLEGKVPALACSACGQDNFILHDKMTALPVVDLLTKTKAREYYPAILTVCANCGHIVQFLPSEALLAQITKVAKDANEG